MNSQIDKLIAKTIALLVFLLPLFFLPLTPNFYNYNKNLLLLIAVAILTILWAIKIFTKKEARINISAISIGFLIFVLSQILALAFASKNAVEALVIPGEISSFITITLLYFIISNNISKLEAKRYIYYPFIASTTILGLIACYQFFGLGAHLTNIAWLKTKTWTPAETSVSLIAILTIGFGLSLSALFKKSPKSVLTSSLLGLSSLVQAAGLGLTVFQILPGKKEALVLLPFSTSWNIALETLKENAFWGAGPGNFYSAFLRFKPISFNQYSFWNSRFFWGSDYPLHLLTTSGLIGLAGFLILIILVIKSLISHRRSFLGLPAIILLSILLLFALPPSLLTFFGFAILAASFFRDKELKLKIDQSIGIVIFSIVAVFMSGAAYAGGRAWLGEFNFKKSLEAIAKTDGVSAYNLQIKAMEINPKLSVYHQAYSQINLALASSLAAKSQLSDEDKTKISTLIQQSIRDAKTATTLSPKNSETWENLAEIYRQLIGLAEGADKWSITGYLEAINNNPVNPRLRLSLGGILYGLGNYELAANQFQASVILKPDFANGYYNLSAAYREMKKYEQAHAAMQKTLEFVPFGTADFDKAKTELDTLAKLLPTPPASESKASQQQEALTEPPVLPSPAKNFPITLPEN